MTCLHEIRLSQIYVNKIFPFITTFTYIYTHVYGQMPLNKHFKMLILRNVGIYEQTC